MRPLDLAIGIIVAGAIALVAYRAHALTRGGALAALVVGALTYATGRIGFTLILLAFFVPSVLLSRAGRARKRELVDVGKAGPRDAMQVLANGGVATVCALLWAFTRDVTWALAFAGAYAAATADTWATEIGTLARGRPRSILTLRPIPTGLSGGVTIAGTLAEVAGALWLGVIAIPAIMIAATAPDGGFGFSIHGRVQFAAVIATLLVLAVPIGGIAGATVDSLLGATLQELRRCDACGRTCETNPHACGAATVLVRGVPWVSNDLVNLAATLTGALVSLALAKATGLH
ncbi:MAG TPA: DUF92 domain-containing protein [Candidatus Elarobacter sp.]